MTSPMDYNQHLLSYLQAWRQLLEASAAMASGSSGLPIPPMPGGMPPMPPTPFMPPMEPPGTSTPGASPPTDYTQQLFGYLQAWRQHLEQAIGAAPGTTPQPTPAQPTGGQTTTTEPTGSQSTGSQSTGSTGSQSTASQSSFGAIKPPLEARPPKNPWGGTRVVDSNFGSRFSEMLATGPERRYGSADIRSGTAFAEKMASVDSGPSMPAGTQSLYFGRAADTPSVTGTQAGRDPRRAAPPATSRWWEAGRGQRPGFKDKPDAKNIRNVRPFRDIEEGP